LIPLTQDAEVKRLDFRKSSWASGMDGLGEQRLANPRLSDDHKRLAIGGKLRDSRLESPDRRAAAYDLDRVQCSGPGMNDQVKGPVQTVSNETDLTGEWSPDSKGLWTLARFYVEEIRAGCAAIRGYKLSRCYDDAGKGLKVVLVIHRFELMMQRQDKERIVAEAKRNDWQKR
jgi:hypothetical protein